MKTVFKKQVPLCTVVLAGMLATLHDFSSLPLNITRPGDAISTSYQNYEFNMQRPEGSLSTGTPEKIAVINYTLTELQEGIYGDFLAAHLKSAPQEYLAIR